MYRGLGVAVVVPVFNAGRRLSGVIDSMPGFVDLVLVVDDGSDRACDVTGRDVEVIRHDVNLGVGAAIMTGYQAAMDRGLDAAVVVAGDGQMEPAEMGSLLDPIVEGVADYVKGDRLSHPWCLQRMPLVRRLGNYCLTFLTRVVTGEWSMLDSQCGYTALRLELGRGLPWDWLYPRYGFPNDMIAAVAGAGGKVVDVTVTPVYDGQASGIEPWRAAFVYPLILVHGLFVRWIAWWRAAGRGRAGRKGAGGGAW